MNVAVLGPGGVGGLVAAALHRSGAQVTVVAREETAAVIAENGLRVRSETLGEWVARPGVVARLDSPVDVLVVATKATGLAAALSRVEAEPGLVVPLLNGLEHVEWLRERFGRRAVAATIRVEADRPEPGAIVHTSRFLRVELAADEPAPSRSMEQFAALLRDAGIDAEVREGEALVLWSKLARLNALACTTSAWDLPIGDIRDDPAKRAALRGCIEETVAVARAEGAELDAEKVLRELDGTHASLGSSMQRDIAAGREPELDAIPGAVLRAGARHGLGCPTVAELAARVAERAGLAAPVSR